MFTDGKGRHRNPAPSFWLQRKSVIMFTGSFATSHCYLVLSQFPFFLRMFFGNMINADFLKNGNRKHTEEAFIFES